MGERSPQPVLGPMINYDLSLIRAIIFDIDGVLSAETIVLSAEGEPLRTVNIKDGYAIQLAQKLGLRIVILTGGRTQSVRKRYEGLGVPTVVLGAAHKAPIFKQWMNNHGLTAEQVVFVGDDIPDLPAMRLAGLAVAPADAAAEVLNAANYVSPCRGGYGVARDLLEQILRARGQWLHDATAFGW